MILETAGLSFSEDQLADVRLYGNRLEEMVKRFGISPEPVSRSVAEAIAASEPNRICSLVIDWATPVDMAVSQVGYGLAPGLRSDADDCYIASEAFSERPSPYPYTELHVFCAQCQGELLMRTVRNASTVRTASFFLT